MSCPVGVMMLAHQRVEIIPLAVAQIRAAWPDAKIQITADRPSNAVKVMLLQLDGVEVLAAPFPAVADREYFLEMRNFQLEAIEAACPEYVAIWDDDHVLEDVADSKVCMEKGYDLVYATKAFFWDDLDHVNLRVPTHRSVFWFKHRPGDRFPLDRMINAPADVHDHPDGVVDLTSRLLDVGYLTAAERARVWEAYKRAGKIDAATMALVDTPRLEKFTPYSPTMYNILKAVFCDRAK